MSNSFSDIYPLSQKISRYVGEAVRDFDMIKPEDKIMLGISGGKDSLLLAAALATLKKRSPIHFDLSGCVIDQSGGTMNIKEVEEYMNILDIPLKIIPHPTYDIIKTREERSPCSLCANMRRGILATEAQKSGCNVIALGHHKDDAAETVLLNLMYGGRFKCFHPNLYMTRTGIRVIRPLIYIEEIKIELEARRLALPVTASCCPYGDKSKRKSAKELMAYLASLNPELKSNLIHALKNLRTNEGWSDKTLNKQND